MSLKSPTSRSLSPNMDQMSAEEEEYKNSARQHGFSLTGEVKSPTMLRAMTRLPSLDTLEKLNDLQPSIAEQIKKTLTEIYSHVTQRGDAKALQVFFHHVASTVLFEVKTGGLIKGKDHAKKAASILKMIDKTLQDIEERIPSKHTSLHQQEILKLFKAILVVHKNAFVFALKQTSDTTQEHLLKHQHHDIKKEEMAPLSPSKKEIVKGCFPTSPSKPSAPGTPQRLSSSDHRSLPFLSIRKKLFDCLDLEGSDVSEDESKDSSPFKTKNKGHFLPTVTRTLSSDSFSGSESDEDFGPSNENSPFNSPSHPKKFSKKVSTRDPIEDSFDDLCSGMDALVFGGPKMLHLGALKPVSALPTTDQQKTGKKEKKKKIF